MTLFTTREDKLVLVSSTTPFMMKSAGNPDGRAPSVTAAELA